MSPSSLRSEIEIPISLRSEFEISISLRSEFEIPISLRSEIDSLRSEIEIEDYTQIDVAPSHSVLGASRMLPNHRNEQQFPIWVEGTAYC